MFPCGFQAWIRNGDFFDSIYFNSFSHDFTAPAFYGEGAQSSDLEAQSAGRRSRKGKT